MVCLMPLATAKACQKTYGSASTLVVQSLVCLLLRRRRRRRVRPSMTMKVLERVCNGPFAPRTFLAFRPSFAL